MDSAIPETVPSCAQCGGELHPDEGQIFLTCPYCGSTVYLDKARVVFHWQLAPTLDEPQARAALMRWMAGNQTVKDLDRKSQLTGSAFEYFPIWYFKQRRKDGDEFILVELAAASSVSELRHLRLPAGDLRKYEAALDSQARQPNVPLQAVQSWLEKRGVAVQEIVEQALVHIPLYTFKYEYQGKPYTALIEAATGSVFANIYPAKSEAPYRLAAGVTAAVFLCLATFPVIGALAGDNGFGFGLLACSGLGVLAAPALLALAAWVAAKV